MIRILLVDDQNLVRQGIKSLLDRDPDVKVIETVTDGRSAVMKINELRPDVVLLDIEMPGMNGITVTKYITRLSPETKVIILSSHEDKKYLTQALVAGAKGYILKSSLIADLKQSILAVNNGYSHIESRLLAKVFDPSNLKPANSKKSSARSSESLVRDRESVAKEVVQKSAVTKAQPDPARSARVLTSKPTLTNSDDTVTLEAPSSNTGDEQIAIASELHQTTPTVPKINLPEIKPDAVDTLSVEDRQLVGSLVHAPATKSKASPLSTIKSLILRFSSSLGSRHRQTFSVTVNGKQYIQRAKNSSMIARYRVRLKQLWNDKLSSIEPAIAPYRAKIVALYEQRILPRLKKWHKKGWLANFGLGVLGLITVIIIHLMFS